MAALCRPAIRLRQCGARLGHTLRGRAPTEARSIADRLRELNAVDPFYAKKINIGLPFYRLSRSKELSERAAILKQRKQDPAIEKLSRDLELVVDLDEVEKEWLRINGAHHIRKIAEHYGVFEHLYDEGYFVPSISMKINYEIGDETCCPVYHGNVIKPEEASSAPHVSFNVEDDSLWTLMLTNLDGHLKEEGKEYLHWCVVNIPKHDIKSGDTLVEYLQPIPPKGSGFHRYVFVLYKQNERVAYDITKVTNESPLDDRTFVTREWYAKYQDTVTPAGLSFFQSVWDASISDVYHYKLNLKEPIYEYDFPGFYTNPQYWFPLKRPFNIYMDKYRDRKKLREEYLLERMKREHPFKSPPPKLRYPLAVPHTKYLPSWYKEQQIKNKKEFGRVKDIE